MFAVVLFVKNNGVQYVPSSWLVGKFCLWPNGIKSNEICKLINSCKPPDRNWTKHKVKILANDVAEISKARYLCKKAEDTDDLASEIDVGRGKRKLKKRKILEESSDECVTEKSNTSSSSDTDHKERKNTPKKKSKSNKKVKLAPSKSKRNSNRNVKAIALPEPPLFVPNDVTQNNSSPVEPILTTISNLPSLEGCPPTVNSANCFLETSLSGANPTDLGISNSESNELNVEQIEKEFEDTLNDLGKYISRNTEVFGPRKLPQQSLLIASPENDPKRRISKHRTLFQDNSCISSTINSTGEESNNMTVISVPEPTKDIESKKFQNAVMVMLSDLNCKTSKILQALTQPKAADVQINGLPSLPIKSKDSLGLIEKLLEKEDTRNQIVTLMGLWGGKNVNDATRRILKNTIAHELALQFNWNGANEKIAFRDLKLKDAVTDAVRRIPKLSFSRQFDIEQVIKTWIKHAKDREGGRNERKNRKEQNE